MVGTLVLCGWAITVGTLLSGWAVSVITLVLCGWAITVCKLLLSGWAVSVITLVLCVVGCHSVYTTPQWVAHLSNYTAPLCGGLSH